MCLPGTCISNVCSVLVCYLWFNVSFRGLYVRICRNFARVQRFYPVFGAPDTCSGDRGSISWMICIRQVPIFFFYVLSGRVIFVVQYIVSCPQEFILLGRFNSGRGPLAPALVAGPASCG